MAEAPQTEPPPCAACMHAPSCGMRRAASEGEARSATAERRRKCLFDYWWALLSQPPTRCQKGRGWFFLNFGGSVAARRGPNFGANPDRSFRHAALPPTRIPLLSSSCNYSQHARSRDSLQTLSVRKVRARGGPPLAPCLPALVTWLGIEPSGMQELPLRAAPAPRLRHRAPCSQPAAEARARML